MEELVFNFDESEAPKKKEVITYEPVEKGIRRKLKDGKKFSYEATADFGRVEIYAEERPLRHWQKQENGFIKSNCKRQKPKRKRSFTKMRVFVWLMWLMNFWN